MELEWKIGIGMENWKWKTSRGNSGNWIGNGWIWDGKLDVYMVLEMELEWKMEVVPHSLINAWNT